MLCRECSGCGLCSGTSLKNSKSVVVENTVEFPSWFTVEKNHSAGEVCIAVDIGTTTLAAAAWSMKDGSLLTSASCFNPQVEYGSDVMARISYAVKQGSSVLEKLLEDAIKNLVESMIVKIQFEFNSARRGRVQLRRIVLCGNTTMLNFALKKSTAGMASFPFEIESFFDNDFETNGVQVYIPPVLSAFIGADALCAAFASGFTLSSEENQFLCDIGTNCEMALKPAGSKKIYFTSTAAGPAFEGYGIEMGSPACPGAIASVEYNKDQLEVNVIGGLEAKTICGSGMVSALSMLKDNGFMDSTGLLLQNREKFFLDQNVYITQNDIRNFQLAKGAVSSGLKVLASQNNNSDKENTSAVNTLFLCGGFGTALDEKSSVNIGLIPQFINGRILRKGNAALTGASMLALNMQYRKGIQELASCCTSLDLAQNPYFQKEFISSLNF